MMPFKASSLIGNKIAIEQTHYPDIQENKTPFTMKKNDEKKLFPSTEISATKLYLQKR